MHEFLFTKGTRMSDSNTTIEQLKTQIKDFTAERNWQQYYSPKNLAMAISIEAAELMEYFRWSDSQESQEILKSKKEDIEDELSDIGITLINFCQTNNIDLSSAMAKKMKKNAQKYPIKKCYGKADKYTDL